MIQILFFPLIKRIYIKKVQKFPEYRVPTDPKIDRKIIRMEQEKAFNMLKKNLVDAGGILRYDIYIVLLFYKLITSSCKNSFCKKNYVF